MRREDVPLARDKKIEVLLHKVKQGTIKPKETRQTEVYLVDVPSF